LGAPVGQRRTAAKAGKELDGPAGAAAILRPAATLGSLPREVLLPVLQLAAAPLSAWLPEDASLAA
jgi:hypothetical protein